MEPHTYAIVYREVFRMKNDSFTPAEIREMLALSRSALRYYIQKGLLEVGKSDENGYHTFTHNNLSDLRNISYLRQMLDFSISDIQDCFNASMPDEYEQILLKKKMLLESEIAQKQLQLERLNSWSKYLSHLKNSLDSIQVVEFSDFAFSATCSPNLDKLALLCTSFTLENGTPAFGGYGYCLDKAGSYEGHPGDLVYRFPAGKYIYAVCSSEYHMDDPNLLTPLLAWAKENHNQVKGPIQVDYFFHIKQENGGYRYFYAVTIPFADCEIEVHKQEY